LNRIIISKETSSMKPYSSDSYDRDPKYVKEYTKILRQASKILKLPMDEVESNMIEMHSNEPENLGALVKRLNSMIEEYEE
jgi:hypothetical protein